ncbi:ATP-binding protein [Cohnella caldifontis]|uniref:ATP-binding protein n=1 Tax=Cohnella caldifontis TaxID=3027471 RepID=UPI0023EDA91F|nr:ATP-binding protein [Cohnella sp. YIM B05605]
MNPTPQQPVQPPFPAPARRFNRRTLKRRVRRLFYLSNMINTFLFACITLALVGVIFKPVMEAVSTYISSSIAEDINSPQFLEQMNIRRLEEFKPASPEALAWKAKMDRMAKIQYFIPLMDGPLRKENAKKAGDLGLSETDRNVLNDDMIIVQVELQGTTVYSNARETSAENALQVLDRLYNSGSAKPLFNSEGEPVGQVKVGFTPVITAVMLGLTFVMFLLMLGIMTMLTLLLSKLFSIPVLKPLKQLSDNIRGISKDRYEDVAGQRVELKRPLREIEELADSTNLIMQKMNSYAAQLQNQKQTLEEQNEELEAQNLELMESKAMIQRAQQEIERKEAALRNILNHAGQGFLTFGRDLLIHPVYSNECARLLSPDGPLAGSSFADLIAAGDEEQRNFMRNILAKTLAEPSSARREIYMPLLLEETEIRGRIVHVDYKIIPDPENAGEEIFMVVLTDITEKRALESQMEEERNTLKMVVKVMVDYAEFSASVKDFRRFLGADLGQLAARGEPVKDKLTVVFRLLHTYKGTFSQWGLRRVTERLHEAESLLSRLGKLNPGDDSDWEAQVRGMDLGGALDEDLALLRETVGEEFLKDRDVLMVERNRLIEIEKKMLSTLSPVDCKALLPDLRKLRYKPFKELLKSYPDYVDGLAARMEKFVNRFEIRGGDFLADTDLYGDLGRTLIHVFRNAVDHGIETAEEREATGKEAYANILCQVCQEPGGIVLSIADDGRGIDMAALRARAQAAGLLSAEEMTALSEEETVDLIFRDEMSTKEQVTELSGRGIGLSSVKAEVLRLGGSIEVVTGIGQGTLFRIRLPAEDLSELPRLGVPTVIDPLIRATGQFFREQAAIRLEAGETTLLRQEKKDKLLLGKVTTFINVRGALEGIFVITADDRLSRALLQHLVIGGVAAEEEDAFVEDGLAEAANVILGNSLKQLQSLEEFILMDPPVTIRTEGASVRYADSEIWTCLLDSEEGQLRVGFVILKKSQFS